MDYQIRKNQIGDSIRVPVDESGPYCPICATSFNGCELEHNICPGCNIQFGDDDTPTWKYKDLTTEQYFQVIRIQWLDKNNWDESLLNQLRDILGVDTDALREAAKK